MGKALLYSPGLIQHLGRSRRELRREIALVHHEDSLPKAEMFDVQSVWAHTPRRSPGERCHFFTRGSVFPVPFF